MSEKQPPQPTSRPPKFDAATETRRIRTEIATLVSALDALPSAAFVGISKADLTYGLEGDAEEIAILYSEGTGSVPDKGLRQRVTELYARVDRAKALLGGRLPDGVSGVPSWVSGKTEAPDQAPPEPPPAPGNDDKGPARRGRRGSGGNAGLYEGEPHYPVPAIVERERGNKNRIVTPDVISLPDQSGLSPQEKSRRERLDELSKKLGGFDKPPSPNELYERRAELLAGRLGLTDKREAVLAAEQAYYAARKVSHLKRLQGKEAKENLANLKQDYDKALFEWGSALGDKAKTSTEKRDMLEALVIKKRDTLLRPLNVENAARQAAFDEKGKTIIGSIDRWVSNPTNFVKALNAPFSLTGKAIAWLTSSKARQNDREGKLALESEGKKYARAVRILAGAGFATAAAIAATPVAASGALLTFAIYAGRGALGTALGIGAAKGAGVAYRHLSGDKKRRALHEMTRTEATDLEAYQAQQQRYQKQNYEARGKEKAVWQMVAATVTGGGVGLATSPLAHEAFEHFGKLEGVQQAQDTIANSTVKPETPMPADAHAPHPYLDGNHHNWKPGENHHPYLDGNHHNWKPGEDHTGHQNVAPEAEPAAPTAPNGSLMEATITKGQGFDHIFKGLQHQLGHNPDATGVEKHLQEHTPDELSREVGALKATDGTPLSMIMKVGDKLVLDKDHNLWLEQANGQNHLIMQSDPSVHDVGHEGVAIHNLDLKDADMRAYGAHHAAAHAGHQESIDHSKDAAATDEKPADTITADEAKAWMHQDSGSAGASPAVHPDAPSGDQLNPDQHPAGNDGMPPVANNHPDTTFSGKPSGESSAVSLEDINRQLSGYGAERGSGIFGAHTEPYDNSHEIPIDPSEPHVYLSKDSFGRMTFDIVGGTTDQARKLAEQLMADHRDDYFNDHDSIVRYADTDGGEPVMQGFKIGPGDHSPDSRPIDTAPPDPDTFTARFDLAKGANFSAQVDRATH